MAFEKVGATIPGAVAAADLSTHQFKLVKMTATGINVAGAGELTIGALQNKPAALDRAATVWGTGSVSKIVAGAAVLAGASVAADATGRAVTAVLNDNIAGVALDAAGAAGDIISVFIFNPGISA